MAGNTLNHQIPSSSFLRKFKHKTKQNYFPSVVCKPHKNEPSAAELGGEPRLHEGQQPPLPGGRQPLRARARPGAGAPLLEEPGQMARTQEHGDGGCLESTREITDTLKPSSSMAHYAPCKGQQWLDRTTLTLRCCCFEFKNLL